MDLKAFFHFCAKKTTEAQKAVFLTILVLGYMVHLYAFTNLIPNSDGLSRVYSRQNMPFVGRWFLRFVNLLQGNIESPALIGGLSLLVLALAGLVIVSLCGIQGVTGGILTGSFMVCSIALTYTYTFIFTALPYAVSILLAVSSVWCCLHWRHWGWLIGGVLLSLSLGIYQTYLAAALSVAVIALVHELLLADGNNREMRHRFMTLLFLFIAGVALYFAELKLDLYLQGTELSNYRNNLAITGMADLLRLVKFVYSDFFAYLFSGSFMKLHARVWILFHVIFAIVFVANIIALILRKKLFKKVGIFCLLLILGAIFPLCLNFPSFLSPSSQWMRYSIVFFYIGAVAAAEWKRNIGEDSLRSHTEKEENRGKAFVSKKGAADRAMSRPTGRAVGRIALGLFTAAFLLLEAQIDNTIYMSLDTAQRATNSFLTTLVSRVQGTDGYRKDMQVVIIGTPDTGLYKSNNPYFLLLNNSASPAGTVILSTKHIYQYLNGWLNIAWQEPSEEEFIAVSESKDFQDMPLYPDSGSIKIVDDKVYVRLSESYKPKQQFELEYEKLNFPRTGNNE